MHDEERASLDARLTLIEDRLAAIEQAISVLRSDSAAGNRSPVDTVAAVSPSLGERNESLRAGDAAAPDLVRKVKAAPKASVEGLLAGRGMQFAGLVLILVATALFYQMADSRGWIGPFAKATLGLGIGASLMAFAAKKLSGAYELLAEALIAVGAGVLYLTLWASAELFAPLQVRPEAGALMVVVTGALLALGVTRNSTRLVMLGGFGGYLTPKLIAANAYYFGDLAIYLVAFTVVLVGVAIRYRFQNVAILALVATWSYIPVLLRPVDGAWNFVEADLTIVAFFAVIAVGATLSEADSLRVRTGVFVVNAILFAAAISGLPFIGSRTAGIERLAAAAILGLVGWKRSARLGVFARVYGYTAIALVTFSLGAFVPNATKIGLYVLESLVLVVAGRRGNDRYLRWAGTIIFVLCGWALLGEILIRPPAAALSVAFDAIVWLAVYAYLVVDKTPLYVRASDRADVKADIVPAALRVFADIIAVMFLRRTCIDLWAGPNWNFYASNNTEFVISIVFTAYALGLFWTGLKKKAKLLRVEGMALFAITILKVFAVDLASVDVAYRIGSFIVLGIVLFVASAAYTRMMKAQPAAALSDEPVSGQVD